MCCLSLTVPALCFISVLELSNYYPMQYIYLAQDLLSRMYDLVVGSLPSIIHYRPLNETVIALIEHPLLQG
ncbi:hypothetical protein BJX63DRAFT_267950 [Aspergillus granulosus]|uniref:Secreted protein n=1 Tax=Aspergillus granulosus TaxID=176169 RepID=A0ABR4H8K3_9EURO